MPLIEYSLVYESHKKMKNSLNLITFIDLFTNTAVFYFTIFHIVFFIFIYTFLKTALMDPGRVHERYAQIYSIEKYYEIHDAYYQKYVCSLTDNLGAAPILNKHKKQKLSAFFIDLKSSKALSDRKESLNKKIDM
jgi:hypothetical protein